MKRIIILENNGGRLANQLWNYASVYSYALEKGIACENYLWFRYHRYFSIPPITNWFARLLFFILPSSAKAPLKRLTYNLYSTVFKKLRATRVLTDNGAEFNLPPSDNSNAKQCELLKNFEMNNEIGYLSGWLFRNPVGLKKYHSEIKNYFKPKAEFVQAGEELVSNVRRKYSFIVGVHVRQGDYRKWEGGKYYFAPSEVRKIIDDFVQSNKINLAQVAFVACSDEPIDESVFFGLNSVSGPGHPVGDLHTLSLTDLIIGSHSTYGTWAAYYGSIPFVEFSRQSIIWPKIDFKNAQQ